MKGELYMKLFANLFSFLGQLVANTSSSACIWSLCDEEEMPESLLK